MVVGGVWGRGAEAKGTMARSMWDIRGGQENNKLEPPRDAEDDTGDWDGEIVQAGDQWNEMNKAVQEADTDAHVCTGCRLAAGRQQEAGRRVGADGGGGGGQSQAEAHPWERQGGRREGGETSTHPL